MVKESLVSAGKARRLPAWWLAAALAGCGGGGGDGMPVAVASKSAAEAESEVAEIDVAEAVPQAASALQASTQSRAQSGAGSGGAGAAHRHRLLRPVEALDRGLVAVRADGGWLLSWRLLGTEYGAPIGFDVYKNGRKLNQRPVTDSTNFLDTTSGQGSYRVRAVLPGGRTLAASKPALELPNGYLNIPLRPIEGGDYFVQHAWPGDLDGDGQYEFVVSRLPQAGRNAGIPSYLEAYRLDGTFLWRVNLGVHSYQRGQGIAANDAPAAAISGFGETAGYRNDDMVTVFDLDLDGRAEVLVRTATGTTFADSSVVGNGVAGAAVEQFISVIRGATGTEVARTPVPADLAEYGPVGGNFGVGFLDGQRPSLITRLVARGPGSNGSGFQWLTAAWDFDGTQLSQRWKWVAPIDPAQRQGANRFHQIRIVDVDGDGRDEIADGNYVLNADGTLRYVLDGAIHGDRFHIGEFDPSRPGLEGFAIQQTEVGAWSNFPWYTYDASSGTRLVTGQHLNREPDRTSAEDERLWDVPRGTVADIDPRHPGLEFWAALAHPDLPAAGVHNIQGERISRTTPSVNFRIWWDGDVGAELLDGTIIDKWQPETETSRRLFAPTGVVATTRTAQPFSGDVLGDWREEILLEAEDHTALRLYSTPIPTRTRLYTLAHNPAYRQHFTVRGYLQSHLPDYYLGWGMAPPPRPRIRRL